MSNYRSAYEEYYKNINNHEKRNKDKSKYSILGKKTHDSIRQMHGVNANDKTITGIIVKRIITELTGATILLLFFVGLKYIPLNQIEQMHVKCKQTLTYNFNYDECIEAFNSIQIGNKKGKDLRIGNFTSEDLKIDNLKLKVSNFIEYLKNNKGTTI